MEEVRDSVVLTLSIPSEMNPTRSKRLLPFGIALALLAFLFWQPFFRLPWVNVSPFAAVPKGAPVIFQLNPGEAADSTGGWDSLFLQSGLSIEKDLMAEWARFRDECRLVADSLDLPSWRSLTLSLHPAGRESWSWLFVADGRRLSAWEDFCKNAGAQITQYRGHPVYTFASAGKPPVSFTRYRNLLIGSRWAFLVEDAIRQLEGDSWQLAVGSWRGASVVGWWQGGALGAAFSSTLNGEHRSFWEMFGKGGWLTMPLDTTNHLEAFWTPPTNIQHPTSNIQSLTAAPDNLSLLLAGHTPPSAWTQRFPGIEQRALFDRYIRPWLSGDWIQAWPAVEKEAILALGLTDEALADSLLDGMVEELGVLSEGEYQTYPIRQVLAEEFLPRLLPGAGDDFQQPFFARVGPLVVFTRSRTALEDWISHYLTGQTMGNFTPFLEMQAELPPSDGPLCWVNSSWLSSRYRAGWTASKAPLADWLAQQGVMLWQAEIGKDGWHWHGRRGRGGKAAPMGSSVSTAWRVSLDAPVVAPPRIVRLDGRDLCFLQDAANQIYCLELDGRLRWKRTLDSRMLSDFERIDYYGDGDGQLLINTREQVYLLDAQGNPLAGYPLVLQLPATNGLTLTDFNGRGDYAYFLGSENGRCYGFDKTGRPLPGWGPKEGVGQLPYPLRHFQYEQKDFLVLLNDVGFLQVYQRNGEERFPPLLIEGAFQDGPDYQVHPQSTRIVVADQDGKVLVVNHLGESFALQLQPGGGGPVDFAFADIGGDARKDYLALQGRKLAGYGYEKAGFKRWFTHTFPHAQDELFAVAQPGSDRSLIGTVDTEKRQIWLLDGKGQVQSGFPLAGTTRFALTEGGAGKYLLVVGWEEQVYCYLVER